MRCSFEVKSLPHKSHLWYWDVQIVLSQCLHLLFSFILLWVLEICSLRFSGSIKALSQKWHLYTCISWDVLYTNFILDLLKFYERCKIYIVPRIQWKYFLEVYYFWFNIRYDPISTDREFHNHSLILSILTNAKT